MSLAESIGTYAIAVANCGLAAGTAVARTRNAGMASKCSAALRSAFGVLSDVNTLNNVAAGTAPVTPTTGADLASIGVYVSQSASDAEIQRIAQENQAVITELRRQTMEDLRTRMDAYNLLFEEQKQQERTFQYVAAASALVLAGGIGASYYFYKKGSV